MKHFLIISCILVGAMICPYGQGEVSTSIVWEIDGPDEPRSPATHLLDLDGRILVGSGGKRILEYTPNGQPVSTLVNAGGQDIGGFRDIEIVDNNLLVHAWEPGYGISVAKYDDEGHSLFYADVTYGQSGAGSILDLEGDLVMAWASNCCGTGQTWDTELKRFDGHSANVIWNTDLCYACNSSLGCCSHGLDYPQQVALHNGNLYVFKENVTDPYFSQIGVQKVNLQGQIVLDIILDDYRDFMKAVPHADGILVSGNLGDTPHRIPFVSNMNDEGQELWTVTAPNVQNASPADLVALDNGTFLFVYFEGSTFYFSEITAGGDLLNTSSIEVNHPIMELEFTHEMGAHVIQLSETEFMLAYNHGTWYDDTHFSLVRFTRSEIEAAERNGGVIQMDGINDYASFTLPAGWGESSFSVSFSCTIEDFGTSTEIDGSHYLFGHGLTHQNGDIGFKAQLHPENHTVMWGFSDDDGNGVLEIHLPPELDLNTWYAFTLVVDRDNGAIQAYIDGEEIMEESIPSNLGNLESGLPVALGAFVYPPSSDYRHFHEGAFADVHFFPAALTASQVDSLVQQCEHPTILGSEHWGVNNDQYVNLTTMEPSVVSGGVIMNGIDPCQTPCAMTDTEQLPCTSIPNHIPTDGLIAFYPFDGNAHDESGNEHNGIITGATFAEDRTGLSNAAIEFLGSTVAGTNRTQVAVDNHVLIPNFNDPFYD
ncbi:MAG: LamG-like jellyroll fold domain-containing protein, partial [Bacteroidota bacterium]|nr:LamG-like jellyroll fold domain-containing protein [Bacteroidota bacterium]